MRKSTSSENAARRSFLERVSRMYYVLDLNQKEIAEKLGVGRSSVARFLSEARSEGIVQIHIGIESDSSRRYDLENRLMEHYKITDSVVAKRSQGITFETVAVNYINSILPLKGTIGLSGGRTLYSIGQYVHLCDKRPQLKICQLSGGAGDVPSTSVTQSWADALLAKPVYLHAPAVVKDMAAREVFLNDENIKNCMKEIANIDLIIAGIGNTEKDVAILSNNFIPGLTSEILKEKSVGDINFHFFDSSGVFSNPDISDFVIGISTIDFVKIKTRIGIAYGKSKVPAIKAAIKGKLINILITDEITAQMLLE